MDVDDEYGSGNFRFMLRCRVESRNSVMCACLDLDLCGTAGWSILVNFGATQIDDGPSRRRLCIIIQINNYDSAGVGWDSRNSLVLV